MIGIIKNDLGVFGVVERIQKKYSSINIYISREEEKIERVIPLFVEKGCKIIITSKELCLKYEKEYSNIAFLALEDIELDNSYVLNDENLVKAIKKGKLDEVNNILDNTVVEDDKVIVLNEPVLLFIESIIHDKFRNKIINSVDLLINDIEIIILNKKLNIKEEGIVEEIMVKE